MSATASFATGSDSLLPFCGTVGELDYRPVRVVPKSCSIADASRHFAASDIEYLVVHDHRIPIGVVHKFDLIRQNMTRTLPQTDPVSTIMSTEVVTVEHDESVLASLMFMIKHDVRLLVVMRDREVMGIVSQQDWTRLQAQYPTALLHELATAPSLDALVTARRAADQSIWRSFETLGEAAAVARIVTAINDTTTRKVIALALGDLEARGYGPPPVGFAWLGMGSQGRAAQTIVTDQDNGLLHEDVPASEAAAVQSWFARLAGEVVAGLERCGFSRCNGDAMATNPELCGSLQQWQSLFGRIVRAADDRDLFEAAIYFDFRCIHGQAALAAALRRWLGAEVAAHPFFLRHLVEAAVQGTAPPIRTVRWALYQRLGIAPPPLDIKQQALMPLDACVRVLALEHGIEATPTLERLRACLEQGGIPKSLADATRQAFDFLFRLRFKQEFSARGAPPDRAHLVDIAALLPAQGKCLADALSAVSALRDFSYERTTGRGIPWRFR